MESGVNGREGEGEREERIKQVRDGAQEKIRNDMGREMTIGKNTLVFQINRTNKTSIKEDINILGFTNFLDHCAVTFVPHNEASHQLI